MKRTVKEVTVDNRLCVSCGICGAVCPQKCISFEEKYGQYVPSINNQNCIKCGICTEVCSAHSMDFLKYASINGQSVPPKWIVGEVLKCYNGFSLDNGVHINGTSGGLITTIIESLLNYDVYDKTFLIDEFNYSSIVETKLFHKNSNLHETQKSRYIPVSHRAAVTYMLENRSERLIFVATSCVIHTLLNVIDKYKLSRDNYLLLGLFCDRTLNQNIFRYFENKVNDVSKLEKLYFRTKEKSGWPGDIKLELKNGDEIFLSKFERMKVKDYFQLERCLYCVDKLNQFSDISFGDNYTKKNDSIDGSNSIIVRSLRGERAINKLKNAIEIYEVDTEDIEKSQAIENRNINFAYANILHKSENINLYPGIIKDNEKIENVIKNRVSLIKRKRRILIGKNYPMSKGTLDKVLSLNHYKVLFKSKIKRVIGK